MLLPLLLTNPSTFDDLSITRSSPYLSPKELLNTGIALFDVLYVYLDSSIGTSFIVKLFISLYNFFLLILFYYM